MKIGFSIWYHLHSAQRTSLTFSIMQVCWQQVLLVFFYLIMVLISFSFLNDLFIGYRILGCQLFPTPNTLRILFHSLPDSMVFNKKWNVNWIVVLLYVLCHFSLGLYHWLSTLLTTVCLDVGFCVFIVLGVSISYLQISVFFPFGSFSLFLFLS